MFGLLAMHLVVLSFGALLICGVARKDDGILAASMFTVLAASWQAAMLAKQAVFGGITPPPVPCIMFVAWMFLVTPILGVWALKTAHNYLLTSRHPSGG